ncbi:MAG: T9SS type A sorting domain-containing protein [Chitinophagaceae bacterium]|nr:T9SS type A sorting domain-containing protein [Chitinophagaceae bacterium]
MKKFVYPLIMLVFFASPYLSAQNIPVKSGPVISGNLNSQRPGSILANTYALPDNGAHSTVSRAPQGSMRYERTVYFISASELAASGLPVGIAINLIGFNYFSAQDIPTTGNLKVFMQNTTDASFMKTNNWAADTTSMITVSNSSITIPAATGFFNIPFSGGLPFTYTGGGLYIAFQYENPSNPLASVANSAYCNNTVANSLWNASSNVALPVTLTSLSAFRPATRLGYTLTTDAAVDEIYTLGQLPIPEATPHVIVANIRNSGDNTLTNLNVTLNITGANNFSDNKVIASLSPGTSVNVSFAPFSPISTGLDHVTVSLPADNYIPNNSKTVPQLITNNVYNYAYGTTPSGGIGFTGSTGDLLAKFQDNTLISINKVNVNFVSGGQPFQITIWDATGAGGTPGTNLYTSPTIISATGDNSVTISPLVNISSDFYVGVRQTSTTIFQLGYEIESPIRTNVFYYMNPIGGTIWTDFAASTNLPYRLLIAPQFTSAALPVVLSNFVVNKNGQVNELNWSTLQEFNTSVFSVEHSTDGSLFVPIGEVSANGNSNNLHNYHFTDSKPMGGINYYRLKIVDRDGNYKYSDIKSVKNNSLLNISVYPNPAVSTIKLYVSSEFTGNAMLSMTDAAGKQVSGQVQNIINGDNTFNVDISKLSKGNYFIKLKMNTETVEGRFIKL